MCPGHVSRSSILYSNQVCKSQIPCAIKARYIQFLLNDSHTGTIVFTVHEAESFVSCHINHTKEKSHMGNRKQDSAGI